MSPLTKTFVALHVILSAMLVAGVIVFVNNQQAFRDQATAATDGRLRAERALNELTLKNDADVSTYRSNVATLTGTIDNLKQQVAAGQQKNNEQVASLADLSSKMAMQTAENGKLAEGIKASQETQSKLNDAVAELRTTLDTRVAQASQLNSRISELTNNLDVTERERKFLAEQLQQARADIDSLSGKIQQATGRLPELGLPGGSGPGPVRPINGVVRNVDQIAGSLYATISVGSADSVNRGMEFSVVERGTGKYLGKLTVTAVEANEASGRITGPATQAIGPGAEVKTQL